MVKKFILIFLIIIRENFDEEEEEKRNANKYNKNNNNFKADKTQKINFEVKQKNKIPEDYDWEKKNNCNIFNFEI